MATTLVLLSLLLSLTSSGVHSSHGLYYVRPTEPANATSLGQPCLTLDEYAENETEYFISNIRMVFLPGEHKLSQVIVVANVTNTTLVGYDSTGPGALTQQPGAHIVCDGPELSLSFTNVTLPIISALRFSGCGASGRGTIVFKEVFDFQLLHIIISGDGHGISVRTPFGTSIISDSELHSGLRLVMVISPPDDFHLPNHLIIENSTFLSSGVKITGPSSLCSNVHLRLTLNHVTIHQGNIIYRFLLQSIIRLWKYHFVPR